MNTRRRRSAVDQGADLGDELLDEVAIRLTSEDSAVAVAVGRSQAAGGRTGSESLAAQAAGAVTGLISAASKPLLNNLLYDTSQLAIPTDNVDPDQLLMPSLWDIAAIRRFMLFFGSIS